MSGSRASHGGGRSQRPRRLSGRRMKAATFALLCLIISTTALTRWLPRPARESETAALPSAAPQGHLHLAKEYIYVGDRLVATEEPPPAATPTPPPVGPAPAGLVASFNQTTGGITVTWNAPASGAVSTYSVERLAAGGQFATLSRMVTATTFSDQTAVPGGAYLYRVSAIFEGGVVSTHSNTDLATAIAFADDPLVSSIESSVGATTIRAVHVSELREAVNAVRALAGLSPIVWTFPAQPGSLIKLEDLLELRAGLAQARRALGLAPLSYTDPELVRGATLVRKVQELRDAVK
jgi:hypothetical protein